MENNYEQFSIDFGAFLEANRVWIIAVAAAILIGAFVLTALMRKKHETKSAWTIRELSAAAMCLALAFLLSFIKVWEMPQGGSITPASMLPIMLFAYVYGTPKGLIVGLAYGLLQCLQSFYVVHWAQFLLDYGLAFIVLGLAGVFKKSIYPGMALAGVLRYVAHVASGAIFFAEYAAPGQSALVYSLLYNSFALVDLAICIGIAVIPPIRRMIESFKRQAEKSKVPKQRTANA
ncbi:MAG: energy-coupled thiamine transporter ThiT [Eubacteriales bacterium]|nr:energy-coupled thiamine transporter ThiT [Eubacteriales bacterium]